MILLVICSMAGTAFAQNALSVSGKVTSLKGDALAGVSVLVKGTKIATSTGADGSYTIQSPSSNGTLVFTYIGFGTKEVQIGGRSSVDVTLTEDVKSLKEVVVIGYGERQRKDVTGAVSSMNADEISKSPSQSPELAMQGRLPGVFVSTPGGSPTARPTVRIRGVSTFGNAEPLYVVDGIPLYEYGSGTESGMVGDLRGSVNVLNTINPNDIESISVLKDATASAIYGVRASNGVILITTKKGKAGRARVEVAASKGVQNITKTFDVLNVSDYVGLYQEMFANSTTPNELPVEFQYNNAAFLGNLPTIDWQKPLINENAAIEDYSARVLGGSESTTYYFSGGFNRTQSPLIQNDVDRYTFSANLNSKISKVFSAGANFKLSYLQANDNTGTDLQYAALTSPWQPIYDPSNPYGYAPSVNVTFKENLDENGNNKYDANQLGTEPPFLVDQQNLLWGTETNSNIFAQQALNARKYGILRNMGTAFFEVQPITGLKFRGTLGMDWTQNKRSTFADRDAYLFSQTPGNPYTIGLNGLGKGTYGERYNRNYTVDKEFSITYSRDFGKHNLNVLLNASDQSFRTEFLDISYSNLESRNPLFRNVANKDPFVDGFTSFERAAVQGYLGRLSYNYASKYYLDATLRRDGSSRFAPGYKWGTFPAVSAAWRISSESFMKNISFINDLKIRGGWGQLGNQETASYAYLSKIASTPDYAFGSGPGNGVGNWLSGVALLDFPVQDLSWETAETTNFGFDGTFFNNRLSLTAEYYTRKVKDILQSSNIAASVGNQNQPVLNIASVMNRGVELDATYNGKAGEFGYSIGGNLTTVRNRVTKTFKNNPFGDENGRIEVGKPLFYLWGYEEGGIFQSQEEIDNYLATTQDENNGSKFAPGDMWFKDVKTNPTEGGTQPAEGPDGKVNNNDRTYLGKTIPGFYYGFNLAGNFKNFDLSIFFQGVGDVQRYNYVRAAGEQMNSKGVNQWTSTLERWTPENHSTTMPRAVYGDPAQNNRFSSRFIEDAGFLRLKNVQLGYTLPQSLKKSLGFVDNFRIYASGINLFTATKWTGLDPENDLIPPTRSFTLGINASF